MKNSWSFRSRGIDVGLGEFMQIHAALREVLRGLSQAPLRTGLRAETMFSGLCAIVVLNFRSICSGSCSES